MPPIELRPHQAEAVDAVLSHLQTPLGGRIPPEGLRTQVIAATGSGKTLIAVESARRFSAGRVLVLVPTLDLLTQMAGAWRRGGRRGAMVGVCSLRAEESDGIPCTTDPGELVAWVRDLEQVTVFATYAAVGLGILQRAHEAGLPVWDLMVVDEAHRTSGDGAKPWAAVHDQERMPAVRRLYMTATPRVWEADGEQPRLVASMDRDSPVFGPVAYELKLSEAIRRGIVAPYQVLCVDIRDPYLYAALAEETGGSDRVRGARLAALQTGLLTAAARERLRRILTFHSRVSEAEAMARGVPLVAARLAEDDPEAFPAVERVWAEWLYGEHAPGYRREVLDEFASDFIGGARSDIPAAVRVLSSVKVLGEGVDTARCDAVAFCDARGSMVDIVQMVGRALRMNPGEGKLASLVVPVFLSPDEDADDLLTSDAYGTLAKVLGALRAHDADTIEALADPRQRSGRRTGDEGTQVQLSEAVLTADRGEDQDPDDEHDNDQDQGRDRDRDQDWGPDPGQGWDQVPGRGQDWDRGGGRDRDRGEGVGDGRAKHHAGDEVWVSQAAAGLLRFSSPRDPAMVAQFVRLRVIDPENTYWRRGIAAATRWRSENSGGQLRVPYDYVLGGNETESGGEGESRGGSAGAAAGFPLGRWVADQRRSYNAGTLEASRIAQLDALGMVWSHHDIAWEEGLTVARAWAAAHGHFLPPVNAVGDGGYPIGIWAKNQRAAARRAWENAERRATGQTVPVGAGELSESRLAALEAIDPGWCPLGWDVAWQRCFTLARIHVRAGGVLPERAGEVVVQGEDLGAWAVAQRQGWDKLSSAQQWLLGSTLGLEPAGPAARPGKLTAEGKWVLNLRAARQFHAREGHLRPGRKHIERVDVDGVEVDIKLGTWLDNTRRRADKLTLERHAQLDQLGMRW
ncbi:Helicase associated domain protein [Streptomyces sp. NPDC046870]|uniref:DEAD/DEAH box helicase n=1 Tax=Streptomyces sp. NPDC046870 TaxID=3155135 RepID=UPI003455D6D4